MVKKYKAEISKSTYKLRSKDQCSPYKTVPFQFLLISCLPSVSTWLQICHTIVEQLPVHSDGRMWQNEWDISGVDFCLLLNLIGVNEADRHANKIIKYIYWVVNYVALFFLICCSQKCNELNKINEFTITEKISMLCYWERFRCITPSCYLVVSCNFFSAYH